MAKSKLGMATFDIDKRFESKEQAFKHAKRLRKFIRYNCKKRNWATETIISISNIKGSSSNIYLEQNGKVGRPRKKRINYESIERNVDWHIHVLLVSKPSYAFRKIIKDYLDKNWFGGKKKEFIYDSNKYDEKLSIKDNYNKIKDYYWNITSKQNKKKIDEYMKVTQIRKSRSLYRR